ncbi:MAG: decaprenyl-phosphate phosphoribosyltransferase [bacterium]|nr:decaprenyl-phosphate phosphoribosyltransferase [bacterium]
MLKYFALLRPHQWIKNLLILFPPFFAGTIILPGTGLNTVVSLLVFSAAASCSYIINDIKDIEADRGHKLKQLRSIANGSVSVHEALIVALLLLCSSLAASFLVSPLFWAYILAYLFISISYTLFFKHIAIVDIFFISAGFVVRVMAGGEAFDVPISDWLFLTVFLVSLFLASGKRMGEMFELGDKASDHRASLAAYSRSFIEGSLWFSASAALVTYSLYTIEQKNGLFFTVPLCSFGLLRYIYIVRKGNGDPTDVLLNDRQIMTVGLAWVLFIFFLVYVRQ